MDKHLNWKVDFSNEDEGRRNANKQTIQKSLKNLFYDRRYVLYSSEEDVKVKTGSVALVICLNIGVAPPDVVKDTSCARLECWIDPFSLPSFKAIESIGRALQMQYERWQSRAHYKVCLDPNVETIKRVCYSMRYKSKNERCLFHYNGHGVPMPSDKGEIWVFNKDFTQYIPVSIVDINKWLGGPTLYVFDCNVAGKILSHLQKAVDHGAANQALEDLIVLAACEFNEILPTNPDLPADVFTSCLTTPIKIALRWFNSQNIMTAISPELIDQIPGRLNDRRTPLGELNWIFTAVTDTIAWTSFTEQNFQRLFRQDLLVACLFRNFLLAERILRSYRCTPISIPKLPSTYNHIMWQAWDLALDYCLVQIPTIVSKPNAFKPSTFFSEQLTAFEVWLEFASEDTKSSEQLPIILQVLLSQQHRMRALMLLARFLDQGSWAVNQSLSVGIFPYILKLVESPPELLEILIFIWAKILAVDRSCQVDLIKENRQHYFLNSLENTKCSSVSRMQSAFVLSVFCDNYDDGKQACLESGMLKACAAQIDVSDVELKFWLVASLAKLWEDYEPAKSAACAEKIPEKIVQLLYDSTPEVRAVAAYALSRFLGCKSSKITDARNKCELKIGLALSRVCGDGSLFFRRELVLSLVQFVELHYEAFVVVVECQMGSSGGHGKDRRFDSSNEVFEIYSSVWKAVVTLAMDPVPSVATVAQYIVDYFQMKIIGNVDSNLTAKRMPAMSSSTMDDEHVVPHTPFDFKSSEEAVVTSQSMSPKKYKKLLFKGEHKSNLYAWAKSYFLSPLTRIDEVDYSTADYDERIWKSQINEIIMQEAHEFWSSESAQILSSKRLDKQLVVLSNKGMIAKSIVFHPFDFLMCVCGNDKVDVWNWECNVKLNTLVNHKSLHSKITSMTLLNPYDKTLLTLGSDDNVVRVWDDIKGKSSRLVTAWRVLQGVSALKCKNNVGLVLSWITSRDMMLATGNVGIIRVWDLVKEQAVCDIDTQSDSSATCIASNNGEGGSMAVVGFSSGAMKLYDLRDQRQCQRITPMKKRSARLSMLKICGSSAKGGSLVSCCGLGTIEFWDYRNLSTSVKRIESLFKTPINGFDVHPQAPIMALSGAEECRILDFDGGLINSIKPSDGSSATSKHSFTDKVVFHPYYNVLGVGSNSNSVTVYATESFKL